MPGVLRFHIGQMRPGDEYVCEHDSREDENGFRLSYRKSATLESVGPRLAAAIAENERNRWTWERGGMK